MMVVIALTIIIVGTLTLVAAAFRYMQRRFEAYRRSSESSHALSIEKYEKELAKTHAALNNLLHIVENFLNDFEFPSDNNYQKFLSNHQQLLSNLSKFSSDYFEKAVSDCSEKAASDCSEKAASDSDWLINFEFELNDNTGDD
jgi:Tfp pilus assembly protein PilV